MRRVCLLLQRPNIAAALIFLVFLVYYTYAALTFPVVFNPDSYANQAATRYLVEHRRLPVVQADSEAILFTSLGTTRSLRPPFTYIVNALFAKPFESLVGNRASSQRLGAAVIGALTVSLTFLGLLLIFQRPWLALAGAALVGLLPQFLFLASSNNDDIGAVFSVAMLFIATVNLATRGADRTWPWVLVAMALGLVLQTKFTAWLSLPWLIVALLFLAKDQRRRVVKLLPLLILLVIAAGGWWPLFNMWNYGFTDPAAIQHATEIQLLRNEQPPNARGYHLQGIAIWELLANYDRFLTRSFSSTIGSLEWLQFSAGKLSFYFYGLIVLVGFIGAFVWQGAQAKQWRYLCWMTVVMLVGQLGFFIHHNWWRDIQPQGRYLLPMLVPVMFLFISVLHRVPDSISQIKTQVGKIAGGDFLASAIIVLAVVLHIDVVANRILPSLVQQPYHLANSAFKDIRTSDFTPIKATQQLDFRFEGESLMLSRGGVGMSSVTLSDKLCHQLPPLALLKITASSFQAGGLNIHLDKHFLGDYRDVYWQPVGAGKNNLIFALNSRGCSGVKLSLPRNTLALQIHSLQVAELRVSEHARPQLR